MSTAGTLQQTIYFFPSLLRIVATLLIFIFHFYAVSGVEIWWIASYAIMAFCFLTGYLSSITLHERVKWLVKRYYAIMIPYWFVIVPVIIINHFVHYKNISAFDIGLTLACGSLFIDERLYSLSWYITFILILYLYVLIESFVDKKLLAKAAGLLFFGFFLHTFFYFLAYLIGCYSKNIKRNAPAINKYRLFAFSVQRYCYSFFLVHGGVILFFYHKAGLNSYYLFSSSIIVSIVLSFIVYRMTLVVNKVLMHKTYSLILLLSRSVCKFSSTLGNKKH